MILIKISKLSYFINCIQTNINDLENTWKGIKKLKYPEGTWSSVPCTVIKSNTTLTNPQKLLMHSKNTFKYFKQYSFFSKTF